MSVEALAIALNHSKARGAAKVVLLGIANHINPDNDGAWPSQARLANYANISERAVRSAIDALVYLGEIRVEVGAGQSLSQYKPNRYWLTLRCPPECDGTTNHNSRVEVSDDRAEVIDTRVEVSDIQGGSTLPTNRNTTVKEPSLVRPDVERGFTDFWNVYPRRVGKAAALSAYRKAVHDSDPETINAGARRLAQDPNLPPQQYVPHPATWLNRNGWEDEPYPERQKTRDELLAEEQARIAERNRREKEKRERERLEREKEQADFTPPPRCEHDRIAFRCPVCKDTVG